MTYLFVVKGMALKQAVLPLKDNSTSSNLFFMFTNMNSERNWLKRNAQSVTLHFAAKLLHAFHQKCQQFDNGGFPA